MRLEDLAADDRSGSKRITARVVWEGPHRGPEEIWFETDARFAPDFEPAPETFLTAALPMAAGLGERRLRVAGRVCERLRSGLEAGSRLLASWYPSCREVSVEATEGTGPLPTADPRRSAFLLSGGVDSVALLRRNRRDVPRDDARSFRDAIHLFGWHSHDFRGATPDPERVRMHAEQGARLRGFADRNGLALVPVRSNVRTFHPSFEWSRDVAFGAGMIAAVHALRRRISDVSLASGGFPGRHPPHGAHPDLDPLWSSSAVEVRHGDADRTRLEKVASVAREDGDLAVLEVCLHHDVAAAGVVNCGRCEKCLRTRLALVAVGAEGRAPTLGACAPSVEDVRRMPMAAEFGRAFASEMLPRLAAVGRLDLARALEDAIARSRRKAARRSRWWRRLFRARGEAAT